MSKDSPRKRNIRIIKEQWLPKLELQQTQIMNILPEYAEGSDSNMIIAAKLQALYELCEVHKQAIAIVLEGL